MGAWAGERRMDRRARSWELESPRCMLRDRACARVGLLVWGCLAGPTIQSATCAARLAGRLASP